jgi:Fe-S cluster biogenesis protein NfuA
MSTVGLRERVEAVLGNVRAQLRDDGGDIQIVEVTPEGVATLRLTGCCRCPMLSFTLAAGVESAIKTAVPEIKRVDVETATAKSGC